MAKYAIRTCSKCGIRKPQPEMSQQEVYTETGKSKAGVSGATWTGVFLGDKKSANSVNKWLFNSSQRTYTRKKIVWLCGRCSSNTPLSKEQADAIKIVFIVVVLFLFVVSSLVK